MTIATRWRTPIAAIATRWAAAALPVLFLSACPGEPPPPAPKPPLHPADPGTPLPEVQKDGRLPKLATPTRYFLELELDPTKVQYSGTARIEVELPQKTSFIVLHGRNIDVKSAQAVMPMQPPFLAKASTRLAQGGKTAEELVLAFAKPLPPGTATLAIEFTATFDDEMSGLYRLKDGESWYAFTQFEPTDARRAFPCFDEPSFKAPFDVSVIVPKGMTAIANAPEASREDIDNNRTRFRFARTQPLPTYLVALAVGELEFKETTRYTKPPIRLVATKGKIASGADMTALALEATSGIVDALGDYFKIPYPYDKLDIVAVPDFRSGAMENPGLITFREERLLLDPARASVASRRGQALIIAHELAHQWFGDLVTATWWNDLWLNEGMATWMESRIVDKWRPAYNARIDAVTSAHDVMDQDGLISARAIRQPVISTADADEAFDGITYDKGAALMTTIERWIGEDVFQRGIREYLRENSWKSVEASRLLGALDKASGKDVTAMATSYLDKPGVPEVTAKFECEQGSRWHVELSSGQWRPLGSKIPESADPVWTIPVCVRPENEKKDQCAELIAGAPSMIAGRGCPQFVHPNWGASYYRFALSEKDFVRLAESRAKLDVPARISVLSNAWAAVRSGQLDAKSMLKILPPFDDDNSRQVIEQITTILGAMSDTVVDPEARVAFRKFVVARLGKRKKELGWTPRPTTTPPKASSTVDSSGDEALARRSVLLAMGDVAEDEATLKEADEIAQKWLVDPASVDGDTGAIAMELASRRASAARITALTDAMKKAKNREDRIVAIHALMGFDDDELLKKALDLTLPGDDVIRQNEMRYVLSAIFGRRKAQPIAEAWIRANWDALRKKLPGTLSRGLFRAASVGCSRADVDERAAFYQPRVAQVDGAGRALEEALETVSLCAALRERGAVSLRKALLPSPVTPSKK